MELLNQDVGVAIMGLSIGDLLEWAATLGVVALVAGWLYMNRATIKDKLSSVLSKAKQDITATATHSCEQFNAEVLDVVGLCVEMGDSKGAETLLELMKRHNVAEAEKHCPVKQETPAE